MFSSTLYRLSFLACLWLNAIFLICSAIETDQEQVEQPMTRCLGKCSHLTKDLIGTPLNAKISSRQSCYEECLRRNGELGSLGNKKIKTFLRRIKRDVSNNHQANSTRSDDPIRCKGCLHCPNDTVVLYPTGLKATFYELKNPGRFYANISWDRLHNDTVNWKGYHLIYIIGGIGNMVKCQQLEKNVTSIIVANSSYGLMNGSQFAMLIASHPYMIDYSIEPVYCRVPRSCSSIPTTKTDVKPSSLTSDGFTSSPTTDGFTSSPATKTPRTNGSARDDNKTTDYKVAISVSVSASVFAVAALYLVYRYCYRSKGTTLKQGVDDLISINHHRPLTYQYDVFIIYSSKDEKWVNKTLLQTLEKKHGLKCCIHYRDFTPGILFRQNMVDSVYKCRKTVAVVSKNFFTSGFCETEMEYALRRLIERKDDSLVVIRLDDVDTEKLPLELKPRSYIDCPRTVEKKTWEKKLVNCLKVPITENETAIL